MRPSLALAIAAVYGLVVGIPFVLVPAQVLSAVGLGTPNEALIQLRDHGVTLIGVGIISWMARNATGAPLRGLLWGSIFIQVGHIAVQVWDIAAGIIPPAVAAAGAPFFVIPLALVIVYALALRRA
jgi:hypothetical protein